MEPIGFQKPKIEPETSGMEGMVVCCRESLVGRRAPAPPEAGEGIASSNYERRGGRIGAFEPGLALIGLSAELGYTTFQFLRNFRQLNAFEQAELILQAALDPTIARRAKKGAFVTCFDHFDLLQTAIN